MKSIYLGIFASAMLVASAAAQTSATTQTSGSASSNTSVSASQSGVNANSQNSSNTSQGASVAKKDKRGSHSGTAGASGSSSTSSDAAIGANSSTLFPQGMTVPAVLTKSVDSKKNKAGDEVSAKTVADVLSQGQVVLPRNSRLLGHVTEAKAKANGSSESTLGIAFDKAVLKNGSTIPMQATIQALGAPQSANSSLANDDNFSGSSAGGSRTAPPSGGGGGIIGGATGAVGSTAGSAAATVGEVTGNVGSTVNNTVGGTANAGPGTVGLGNTLSSATTGVVGLKGLQLDTAASSATNGALITSTGKQVKLDSGSQLILKVASSGEATGTAK